MRTVSLVYDVLTKSLSERVDDLDSKRAELERLDAYFRDGNFDALDVPAKARRELWQIVKQGVTPWLRLVTETTAERLIVDGFRSADTDAVESEFWRWWQGNRLDGRQMPHAVEVLKSGYSFVSVWAGEEEDESDESPIPLIVPDSPLRVDVQYDGPDPFEATSAVKVRGRYAWLYPDTTIVHAFEWVRGKWVQVGEVENTLGEIPFVKFRANPDTDGGHVSDLHGAIPIQDRINRTTVDRLLAQAFSAFRQRWATGLVLDADDDGKAVEPFNSAVDRLWITEDEGARFGEFSEATLSNYVGAIAADVEHLAAVTRTPPHYLLGQIVNVNAEALTAAETGLTRKVQSHQQTQGEAWEDVFRLAAKAAGREDLIRDDLETVWRRTETVSDAQRVDAGLKKKGLNVPTEAIWEDDLGASPQTVERWRRLGRAETLRASVSGVVPNAGTPADEPAETSENEEETAQ